jgi:hypothetical protein
MLFANCTGDPFLRDSVHASHVIVNPKPWHMRSFAVTLWSNWIMELNYPDEKKQWRANIEADLNWVKPNQMLGGFDHKAQVFMLGMGGDAVGRYCETNPEDKAMREMLVAAYRKWMTMYPPNEQDHNRVSLANGFAYAARFSGDGDLLTFAAEKILRDSDFKPNYRTGVCAAKNWSEYGHRLSQVLLHDIDKKKHAEKYKDLP